MRIDNPVVTRMIVRILMTLLQDLGAVGLKCGVGLIEAAPECDRANHLKEIHIQINHIH